MRILVLDIENLATKGWFWSLWGVNIPIEMIDEGQKILCWAAKWLDEKYIHFDYENKIGLDHLWGLLDEADAVITFNGRKHDIPHINREFLKAGFGPPSPFKHIDLLETMKKQFKFESNKLQFVSEQLELGTKVRHEGWELWKACMEDDDIAWRKMEKYNKQDVRLTEKLYRKILPWITSHPNMSLFLERHACPYCASHNLQSRGKQRTQTAVYTRYWCSACKGWSRTRYTELDKDARKAIVVPAV